eukprot:EC823871.1.p1 GENE.EC823871.1~~EC823871.1.p1  ORF type:complete len:195 (+),score=66.91 EC823871.1:30-614(+)
MHKRINIIGSSKDKNQRYTMEELILEGNSHKTYIKNIDQIGIDLQTSPNYIAKYFSINLKTVCNYIPQEKRIFINGGFEKEKLSTILKKFIKTFLICKNCEYPEIHFNVENEKVYFSCCSCGKNYVAEIEKESDKKLLTYISKNPPDNSNLIFKEKTPDKQYDEYVDFFEQQEKMKKNFNENQKKKNSTKLNRN